MNTVSTNPWMEVKPKLTNVPAPFNSADLQLEILPADQPVKPAQAQDLQKSDPGARAGPGLQLDIPVLCGRSCKGSSGVADRSILASLNAHLSKFGICDPSYATLARETGYCRRHVIRRVQLMKCNRTFDAKRTKKSNLFTFLPYSLAFKSIWVDPAWIRDYEMDAIDALLLGFWRREAQGTDSAWFKHKKAAEAVGVSRRTVQQRFARFEARHIMQIFRFPGRNSWGNTYTLTGYGRLIIGVSEPEKKAHGCHPKVIRPKEGVYSCAHSVRRGVLSTRFDLSFNPEQDQEVYRLLRVIGIYWTVAKLIAAQWRSRAESVRNMIKNGICRQRQQEQFWRAQGKVPPHFNLAGYVIRGLNIAMAEGHEIELSKAAEKEQAKAQGKPGLAGDGRMTDAEFEQRKQEAIRRLRSASAKHTTPYTDAEMAVIAQKRDKKAEDALLTRTLEAARRNCHIYCEKRDLG